MRESHGLIYFGAIIVVGLICSTVSKVARGQDKILPPVNQAVPSKRSPLRQPVPLAADDRLELGWLATVRRGTMVRLLLMGGGRVEGRAMSIKDSGGGSDAVVLSLDGGRVGSYKIAALEGVEWKPR